MGNVKIGFVIFSSLMNGTLARVNTRASYLRMATHQTTIIDIARALGISKSTVSRALTGHPNVNGKTRQRILDMAAQVDYQRNQLAISLLTNRTGTVGIIVPEFISFFFPKVIIGAQEELARSGYNVVICHSNESYETEVSNAKALLASRVDGLIVSHTKETRNFDHFKIFQRKGIPVVFFNRVCEEMNVSNVTVDDHNGAFLAVEHLIQTGRRRIAHLAGPDTLTNSRNRLNGYRDALIKYGIPVDPELIISYDLNLDKANIYVNHLLNLPNPPDALFAINDPTALEALSVAKRRGIRVPDDLALIGFSDDPISALIEPGLTTIAQPVTELGQQAAQVLVRQLLTKEDEFLPERIVLPTNLIIRGSTVK